MQPLCNMQSQPHCCSWNTFLVYWFLLLGANVPFSGFFLFVLFHFTFFVSLISSVMSIYIDSLYVGFKGLINVRIRRLELFKVQTITSKHLCCFNGVHNYLKKKYSARFRHYFLTGQLMAMNLIYLSFCNYSMFCHQARPVLHSYAKF